jgi:hypothetical protein
MLEKLAGQTVVIHYPLMPGATSLGPRSLLIRCLEGNLQSPYVIEALYQNNAGREFAFQSHKDGRVDYYRRFGIERGVGVHGS